MTSQLHTQRRLDERVAALANRDVRVRPSLRPVSRRDLAQLRFSGGGKQLPKLVAGGVVDARRKELRVLLDYDGFVAFVGLAEGSTRFPGPSGQDMLRLIYSGLVEVEGAPGRFVSGFRAFEHLGASERLEPDLERHPLLELSERAINDALRSRGAGASCERRLARRLYAYNAMPWTRRWQELLPRREACGRWLGLSTRRWRNLTRSYVRKADETYPWLRFRHRSQFRAGQTTAKLYVSPTAQHLPETVQRVGAICRAADVPAFKVGLSAHAVLRPDKLIVYLESEQRAAEIGKLIEASLAGMPWQGVPFTSPLDSGSLVSTAVDPEPASWECDVDTGLSWRWHVSRLLSASIVSIPRAAATSKARAFLIERLFLDYVDAVNWRGLQTVPS